MRSAHTVSITYHSVLLVLIWSMNLLLKLGLLSCPRSLICSPATGGCLDEAPIAIEDGCNSECFRS